MAPNQARLGLQVSTTGLHLLPKLPLRVHPPVGHHRVHQGPNPLHGLELGRVGGRKTKPTPSGTSTRPDTCHPARSKTTSKSFLSPDPRNRAKRRRTSEKASAFTVGSSQNSLSPVLGRTKPYTYSHRYRGRTQARGVFPRGAHTRRYTGFRPKRCSSKAQTSSRSQGKRYFRRRTVKKSFF
jgi:hypothetical protein